MKADFVRKNQSSKLAKFNQNCSNRFCEKNCERLSAMIPFLEPDYPYDIK